MYAAFNQEGKLCYAVQLEDLLADYWCPHCGQRVYARYSKRGKAYFSHGPYACGVPNIRQEGGESQNHYHAKLQLRAHCQAYGLEAELEWPFLASGQYADVFLPQIKTVLEYQHSIISSSQLLRRHQAYYQQGYTCYWLIDEMVLRGDRIGTWPLLHLQFRPNLGNFWWVYCVNGPTPLGLVFGLPMVYHPKHYSLRFEAVTIHDLCHSCQHLTKKINLTSPQKIRNLNAYELNRAMSYIRHQRQYKKDLARLYQNHFKLKDLPSGLLVDKRYLAYLEGPLWLNIAWIRVMLNKLPPYPFSLQRFYQICQVLWQRGYLVSRPNIHMKKTMLQGQWQGLLACLLEYQILKMIDSHTLIYQSFY